MVKEARRSALPEPPELGDAQSIIDITTQAGLVIAKDPVLAVYKLALGIKLMQNRPLGHRKAFRERVITGLQNGPEVDQKGVVIEKVQIVLTRSLRIPQEPA